MKYYNRRKKTRRHDPTYIAMMKAQLSELQSEAKTEKQKELLRKAYELTINP